MELLSDLVFYLLMYTTSSSSYLRCCLSRHRPATTAMALPPKEHDVAPIVVCAPEHCFHACDALFCALTLSKPIQPTFANDK